MADTIPTYKVTARLRLTCGCKVSMVVVVGAIVVGAIVVGLLLPPPVCPPEGTIVPELIAFALMLRPSAITVSSGYGPCLHTLLKSSRSSAQIMPPPRPLSLIHMVLACKESLSSNETHWLPR